MLYLPKGLKHTCSEGGLCSFIFTTLTKGVYTCRKCGCKISIPENIVWGWMDDKAQKKFGYFKGEK